jgi:uncharacterized protein (TIRG00374 family)
MIKKSWVSKILYVFFLLVFIVYFIRNIDDFKDLINLNPLLLLIVVLGYIASIYTSGVFNRIIIVPYGKKISRIEGFRVALISSIGNYFGPLLGGTGLRAAYLKKKVGLKYTDFISTLYGYYVIAFLTSAILGIFSLYILRENHEENGFLILLIFFVTVTTALLIIIYNKKINLFQALLNKLAGKKVGRLNSLSSSWQKIVKHKGLVNSLVKVTLVNIILLMIINYTEFLLIGINLNFGSLLLYTCLGIFSILISLTPGALGIREAIYLFSSGVMGVSSTEILAVALIDRTIQFIVMSVGWIVTSYASRWFRQDIVENN